MKTYDFDMESTNNIDIDLSLDNSSKTANMELDVAENNFNIEIVNDNKILNMELSLDNDVKALDMGMGVVTEGGSGTGGTTNYNDLSNKPSINSIALKGNKSSGELKLYGENNEPPYPVTSVNGMTGNVVVPTGGGDVNSVNGQTGDVVLTAKDVNALSDITIIPTELSQLNNDVGYITNTALEPYAKKSEIPAVPTKTSQLDNDSGFITSADEPTKLSELENDTGFITNSALNGYAKSDEVPVNNNQLINGAGYITRADIPEYNIIKAETAQDGYFATYYLAKDGVNLSTAINIPKDYLVKSADIKTSTGDTDTSGLPEGTKYIDFIINTYAGSGTESHIYLNVNELVDAYTAGDGITISENNVVSAKVVSVNGKVGNVNLTYSDVGALSAATVIPTVNNGKLTVRRNGADVAEFTANNSADVVANIAVPTATSELTNDSNYTTLNTVLQAIYPIGSIYMAVNNVNPRTLFGFGTWVQIKDTFLLAAGDTYAAGISGGEAQHKLTVNELPDHKHYIAAVSSGLHDIPAWTMQLNKGTYTSSSVAQEDIGCGYSVGIVADPVGLAHNNMPPYLAVYVWQRTA